MTPLAMQVVHTLETTVEPVPTTLGGLALLLGVVGLASVVAIAAGCLLYVVIRLGEQRS